MFHRRSPQLLVDLFTSKTIVEFTDIKEALGDASVQTVFRYLKKVPYRRSYNHNGRYYALHEPSRYDQFGLWSWKGIHFSVDGSLKHTTRRLVMEAEAGASHRELQQRLQTRAHNTLLHLVGKKEISREEVARHFIYLHPDPRLRTAQLAKRHEMIEAHRFEFEQVTDAVVIQVLLILIRYPGSRAGDVSRRLKGHSPPITMQHVRVVFDRYSLDDVGEKGGPSRR